MTFDNGEVLGLLAARRAGRVSSVVTYTNANPRFNKQGDLEGAISIDVSIFLAVDYRFGAPLYVGLPQYPEGFCNCSRRLAMVLLRRRM